MYAFNDLEVRAPEQTYFCQIKQNTNITWGQSLTTWVMMHSYQEKLDSEEFNYLANSTQYWAETIALTQLTLFTGPRFL